jgi:Shikimate kinase
MKSIAIIGMPGCGKSTVSRIAAQLLGMDCYDSDAEIERLAGMKVADIFAEFGSDFFRKAESGVVAALSMRENTLLSLGGGAVLYNEETIRANCFVVYLTRDIEQIHASILAKASQRPLVKNIEDLQRTYEDRYEIYERLADIIVDNDKSPEAAAGEIAEKVRGIMQK